MSTNPPTNPPDIILLRLSRALKTTVNVANAYECRGAPSDSDYGIKDHTLEVYVTDNINALSCSMYLAKKTLCFGVYTHFGQYGNGNKHGKCDIVKSGYCTGGDISDYALRRQLELGAYHGGSNWLALWLRFKFLHIFKGQELWEPPIEETIIRQRKQLTKTWEQWL